MIQGSVKSSARTLDIIELAITSPEGLSFSDVGRALNIPHSSLHALMNTLEKRGYLFRDPSTKQYEIGPSLLRLSATLTENDDLLSSASQILESLQSRCAETISISVLDGDMVLYVYANPSKAQVQVVNDVGSRLPAHATATGKIMLAHLSAKYLDSLFSDIRLKRYTKNTIVDMDELKKNLTKARQRGYAFDREESEPGVWAVAACIVNKDGGPAAAVSIVVPMVRVRDDLIPYWSELAIDAANNISSRFNASRGRILGVRREVVDYRDPV